MYDFIPHQQLSLGNGTEGEKKEGSKEKQEKKQRKMGKTAEKKQIMNLRKQGSKKERKKEKERFCFIRSLGKG